MFTVYPPNNDLKFTVKFVDEAGAPTAPLKVDYRLYDGSMNELLSDTINFSASTTSTNIVIPAADNQLQGNETRAFRTLIVTYSDAQGEPHTDQFQYILEATEQLVPGVNSFDTYPNLYLISLDLPGATKLTSMTPDLQRRALVNAWHNIGKVAFDTLDLTAGSVVTFTKDRLNALGPVIVIGDLTQEELLGLNDKALFQLRQAQVIEANALVGGNPIEDRRRMGLISNSSGQSASFFRTSKPLELVVRRETLHALTGLVTWRKSFGRN